jgi:hypothetical protein
MFLVRRIIPAKLRTVVVTSGEGRGIVDRGHYGEDEGLENENVRGTGLPSPSSHGHSLGQ